MKSSLKMNHIDYNYRNSIIYRNNRSRITHSIDPIDPGKYARYFGGVLFALMYDIKADKKPQSVRILEHWNRIVGL